MQHKREVTPTLIPTELQKKLHMNFFISKCNFLSSTWQESLVYFL